MGVLTVCVGVFLVSYVVALPRFDFVPSTQPSGEASGYDIQPLPWEESHPYHPQVERDDLPLYYYGGQVEEGRGRFRRDVPWRFPFIGGEGYSSWAERGRSIGDYFRAMRERRRNYWRNLRA